MKPNPCSDSDSPQRVMWGYLQCQAYQFEFIQPLRALGNQYKGMDSGYISICAECLETVKTEYGWDRIMKGSLCLLQMPIITLQSAWLSISNIQRKQITEEDNVKVIFRKKSQKFIIFEYVERLKAKPEHIEFARKNYAKPLDPKPRITRKEEY